MYGAADDAGDRKGYWFLLPGDPLPEAGSVDMDQLSRSSVIRFVSEGQIYLLDGKNILKRPFDLKVKYMRDC